ncbi:unnamed protein product [Rangifer tarandus platyrhynchus]|uniref:Uncharacterized protein n=1 Tax=Rangifer tarandus platyrhynchus TaxID=3082113 RepID=A0AC59ZFZ7_RANTA
MSQTAGPKPKQAADLLPAGGQDPTGLPAWTWLGTSLCTSGGCSSSAPGAGGRLASGAKLPVSQRGRGGDVARRRPRGPRSPGPGPTEVSHPEPVRELRAGWAQIVHRVKAQRRFSDTEARQPGASGGSGNLGTSAPESLPRAAPLLLSSSPDTFILRCTADFMLLSIQETCVCEHSGETAEVSRRGCGRADGRGPPGRDRTESSH